MSKPLNLASDNVTGAASEIVEAIAQAATDDAMPYGNDPLTERVTARIREAFEHRDAVVFPIATGSAANALALSVMTPPWGVIYCHPQSHIEEDECGAPEFFTNGAKLTVVPGPDAKMTAEGLRHAIKGAGVVHHPQPAALSLTNATERGTTYSCDEIGVLSDIARSHGLKVHLDGARLANALVAQGASPAEMTWKAGVDAVSLGATKNGAFAAEAVVFFDPQLAETFAFRRKRAGHLFSKMRFLSAQLDAYLDQGRWIEWARHANTGAARLAAGMAKVSGVEIAHPVDVNMMFVRLPGAVHRALIAAGHFYYTWDEAADGSVSARMVVAFNTDFADIDGFLHVAGSAR